MDELLFQEGTLADALRGQAQKLRDRVQSIAESEFKAQDREAWAGKLSDEFAVVCPVLDKSAIEQDPARDITLQRHCLVSLEFGAGIVNLPGYRRVVHIPFTGDANVFKWRPNTYTFSPPRGQVKQKELIWTREYPAGDSPNIDSEVADFLRQVDHTSVRPQLISPRSMRPCRKSLVKR